MSELGGIQPQKENDIGGGYLVGETTKYRGRKKTFSLFTNHFQKKEN